MNNFLTVAHVTLPEGIANFDLTFKAGLNFIAGENGTGKSKVLGYIKANIGNGNAETTTGNPLQEERIAFYNPKRNNQKREIQGLLATMSRENRTIQNLRAQLNQNYSDQNFLEYPSFADLFVSSVEHVIKHQLKAPPQAADIVGKDIDLVLSKVMPHIHVEAGWDAASEEATLTLVKYNHPLRPAELSVGENEVLSLALSVFLLRDAHDLYLMDEPEVHLNWSLEQQLFEYLDWFANKYKKQVIVVTHSPVVFDDKFTKMAQFLSWDSGRLVVSTTPTEEITNKLALRVAATFVAFDVAYDKTFFVEDEFHSLVVELLGKIKRTNNHVIVAGGRDKVVALHGALHSKLSNAVFMVDGDNNDIRNARYTNGLFALNKYCLENYFLEPEVLSKISKSKTCSTPEKVKRLLVKKVRGNKKPDFVSRYKPYIELARADRDSFLKLIDTIDGSIYFKDAPICQDLGFRNYRELVEAYLTFLATTGKLGFKFKEILSRFAQ